MIITCKDCGFENTFAQNYAYHAGLSDLGFLYNDEGNLTLFWSTFDPDYEQLVGKVHPWKLSSKQQAIVENALKPTPSGGSFSFRNVPRCANCKKPIAQSIIETINYLAFPDSLELDDFKNGNGLKKILK
jgi:hypothetical protein